MLLPQMLVSNPASVGTAADSLLLSDYHDEDITIIIADKNPDSPSASTSQPNQDLPTPSATQSIYVSPPPTILQKIIMREVCDNIFKDLMELVNSRNQAIHIENYEDKWNNMRSVVNRVFSGLKKLLIQAQNQALKDWFAEVIKSMEAVEVKRSVKLISDSPHYACLSKMIHEAVRSSLDTSWINKVFVKLAKPVLKALKLKEPKEMFVKKLQLELFEQKLVYETLRRQLA